MLGTYYSSMNYQKTDINVFNRVFLQLLLIFNHLV